MDFYYHGAWRMDWGLGNPNKTATLIACLMLSVWLVACLVRRGFWIVLPVSMALGWCLVQTYSRGGMLAALAGLAVLLSWAPRPWPRARTIAAVAGLWITGLFILYAKAEMRYGQGVFSDDQSISSRLVVWKHFPEMLAAAPWGWGWGKAGDAYTQWFQPPDQSINYLNLLNSHFTAMTEGGWIFSMVYVAGWFTAIAFCWPVQDGRMRGVPLAVWTAFGVGGFFSQVEDTPWLWVLPLTLLGVAVGIRFQQRISPNLLGFGMPGLFSAGVVAAIILVGKITSTWPIKFDGDAVVLGGGANKTVIYIDREVTGKLYGHTLRKFLQKAGTLDQIYLITENPEYITPAGVSQIIMSGSMASNILRISPRTEWNQVVLINPTCFPEEMHWNAGSAFKMCVCFGEYSQFASRSSWESCAGVRHYVIEGAGDFVPAWPSVIWNPAGA
jgi:hypothetical protein